MMRGDGPPALPLFLHSTPPFFRAQPFPATSPKRRPRVRIAFSRTIRPCCTLGLGSGAEEEIFIRRHAAPAKPSSPSNEGASKSPSNDADEQFDFVNDAVSQSATAISQPPPDVVEGAPEIKVQSSSSNGTAESKRQVSEEPNSTDAQSKVDKTSEHAPVKVLVPPGMQSIAENIRTETSRLFTESRLLPGVHMPTQREVVLFAWDFALILSVLLLLRAGVSQVLRWIHNRLNATRGMKSNIPYEQSVFECMQRPLEFLSLFTVGTALAEVVSRPLAATGLLRHIRTLRELGMIISATWFLLRWIERIRSRFVLDKRIDNSQVDTTSRIATVVTFVASVLIVLDTIGINVQTVLAFGGIGGVAIGFAGREIISNFFGGFMIYVTRPFAVGEWIRSIEERELNGTVEDIGWYLTRVRTWDKRPLYIPNSRFSTLIVENGSRMDNRRILHTLHVRHEDMPVVPKIIAAMEQLLMTHQELDPRQHRLAYVDSFGDYSVRLWLSCYTKSVFLYDYRRVQQEILIKCYDIIRSNGAKLATINTRDVRPGSDTDRYGPYGSKATFGQAVSKFPEAMEQREHVNTDVPGSPQYGKTAPHVRFDTIESGVDFSQVPQPSTLNGVPVGAGAGHGSAPSATGATGGADDKVKSESDRDSSSQRSASVAAVAAAAAALAAASKNRSRSSDETESTTRPGDGKETADGGVARVEPAATSSNPPGEMRISAAKPARNVQSPSPSSTSTGARNPPSTPKAHSSKGSDDAQGTNVVSSGAAKTELTPTSSKAAGSTQTGTPPGGLMKISKARTHSSTADIDIREPSERSKGKESGERSKPRETSERPKARESSERAKAREGSERAKGKEGSERPKAKESSERPKGKESSERPKVRDSGERAKAKESSERPKVKESADRSKMREQVQSEGPDDSSA